MDNQHIEITPEWIAQQRAVCEAAAPGRWVAVEKGNSVPFVAIVRCANGEEPITIASSISPKRRDYEFIVAAHDNYPAALDALEASNAREAEKDATITTQKNIVELLRSSLARLTAERDAAVKCISDTETYIQLGSRKYAEKTIADWRGPCALHGDEKGV